MNKGSIFNKIVLVFLTLINLLFFGGALTFSESWGMILLPLLVISTLIHFIVAFALDKRVNNDSNDHYICGFIFSAIGLLVLFNGLSN